MFPLGPFRRPLRALRRVSPTFNFLTIHWIYFLVTTLLTAVIFWGTSTPARSVNFTNSLFLTVSAMTEAGLNTVNLSALNTFQQIILFLLILVGSPVWVSISTVHIRRKAFQRKFASIETAREGLPRRSLSKVRSWTFGGPGRSSDGQLTERGFDDDKAEDSGASVPKAVLMGEGDALSQTTTPPERRGGPEMNRTTSNVGISSDDDPSGTNLNVEDEMSLANGRKPTAITFRDDTHFSSGSHGPSSSETQPARGRHRRHSRLFSMQGVGARPKSSLQPTTSTGFPASPGFQRTASLLSGSKTHGDISDYLDSAAGWISRNSQFHNLTNAEREQLGGYEYRAIEFLAWLVPAYFVAWQLFGCIGCAAWVAINQPETARANGINPWWVGAFNAVSAFGNSGMSLLDANMVAFQKSYYMLITMSLLILAGNTAFPLFLRLTVWCLYKMYLRLARGRSDSHSFAIHAKTLKFLLDHPRRCYTNLFPSRHTWWLAGSVFVLNGIDWAAFEILNIDNKKLDAGLPLRFRVIDGLFQAFAVRSGGFYVVTISYLRISLQVLYVVMMYISVYPISISMRTSNVYEERSLGIYSDDQPDENEALQDADKERAPKSLLGPLVNQAKTISSQLASFSGAQIDQETNVHFIQHQLRAQLAHDAWFLVLALFLIMIIESSSFDDQPAIFSVFNFIFEIVSAYGCVGISIGVPYAAYSFSGAWRTLSKLILCAVMLRGRHRGLPVAIDKAVLLPGEAQASAEEEDGRIRIARTMSRARWNDGIA